MDGIFGIGPLELFFIAVIALIVLGPERLPHALREVAKTIRKVRELTSEFTSQFGDELQALDEINPRKILSDMVDPTKPLPGEPKPPTTNSTGNSAANGAGNAAGNAAGAAKSATADKPAQAKANAFVASQAATEQARATKAAKEAKEKEAKAKEDADALAATSAAAGEGDSVDTPAAEEASSTSTTLEPSDGVLIENSIRPPALHGNGAAQEQAQLPAIETAQAEERSETPQPIAADESA